MNDTVMLQFDHVSYRYPGMTDLVLREVNLSVSPGESVLIAGGSGSGKSTFCRASTGLIPHFHGGELIGQVRVDGLDTRHCPVNRLFGHVGLVFQNVDAQLFNYTVEAELAYGLESLGLEPGEIEGRLKWVIDLLDLRHLVGRRPGTLSGGERQRVVIGALLSLRPGLLLLDEPFTHLDPENGERLRATLKTVREQGIAVVMAEHILHEVVADVDRLIILHRGHIAADGAADRVLNRDLSPYGLNLPPLVRLFREQGWKGTPLRIESAKEILLKMREKINLRGSAFSRPCFNPEGRKKYENICVNLEGVGFSYDGQDALKDIHLRIGRGEGVALVGGNGAGKTTLVKHLNGLLKPRRGRVVVLGRDTQITPTAELARYVGFVWQNPNDQLFRPNVREEVLAGPRVLGCYDRAWCDALFERFGLIPLLDRSPFRLSEGEKKRVAFATALASKPELLILDEPTAGQDESFRKELGVLITEWRGEGRTVILVTHDLEFASEYAERWVVMAQGRIVADGPPAAVMADSKVMASARLRPTQGFQLVEMLKQSFVEPRCDEQQS